MCRSSLLTSVSIVILAVSFSGVGSAAELSIDPEPIMCTAPQGSASAGEADSNELPDKPSIPGPCCDIPASAWCTRGEGVRSPSGACTCNPPANPYGCALICPVCW